MADESALRDVRNAASALTGSANDYSTLLERVGDRRFVLLGEATHGTHEFYKERATITQRLIEELGFHAVAVEADWPDAYRVNRFVQGANADAEAIDALGGFQRFPAWMWRNADVLDFVGWLREHNDDLPPEAPRVGFYGLDLYSLFASIDAVVNYLERVDPEAARRARKRYACFDHFGEDTQAYGFATGLGLEESCEREVTEQLMELQRKRIGAIKAGDRSAADELFYVEQNARLVKNSEEYYRSMLKGHVATWNLRDMHMADTLDAIARQLETRVARPKIVVWEHNSHLGDARATDMGARGEWNVGQLVRERHGDDAVLVGFTTYDGTVTAASDWGAPAERKRVRPALPESYEALFHETGLGRFLIPALDHGALAATLGARLERAIGVIYLPETERSSHYFRARMAEQFDSVIHIDRTRAVEPLERTAQWHRGEAPETYPFAV